MPPGRKFQKLSRCNLSIYIRLRGAVYNSTCRLPRRGAPMAIAFSARDEQLQCPGAHCSPVGFQADPEE